MKNYVYSATHNAFFPLSFIDEYTGLAGWDLSDAIEVDDTVYHMFINPPEGKKRTAGKDGLPTWDDIPPPTNEELITEAEAKKQTLIAEVNDETQMLQTKLSLKRIKPAELELLNAWLDYLDLLEAVDTSTAPDIDWPQKPQ
ncbi:MAG TPA: tail fiber assembly protein [Morganella sp. (in: Bacteria)]|nr:tail fiber assembly protein [Morganella sp. (in: enterobacteria)]